MRVTVTETEQRGLSPEIPLAIRQAAPVVVVLGDYLLDGWWRGRTERMCREAPAPVVDLEHEGYAPGGAANTAMNLAALGATVRAVGVIGDDDAGRSLRRLLEEAGIDTEGLRSESSVHTTTKIRVVGAGQVLVRIDDTYRGEYSSDALSGLTEAALIATQGADAEVVCDYGSGLLTSALINALASRAKRPALTVVDAHEPQRWAALRPHLVTPNAGEASRMLPPVPDGVAPDRSARFASFSSELLHATRAQAVIVTLDRDGSVVLRRDAPPHRTWARPAAEKQASGAGDTYVAALTLARCIGLPLSLSADFAQAAADVVVQRSGTSVCSSADLAASLGQSGVLELDELERRVRADRESGRRIVLTNGCFDVLHRGHTSSLKQARALGDVLVVAVNGDSSVRRLKGPGRPVNPAADRAGLLCALDCVDYVTVFDTDTPIPLIERLRPDIYAKGGDYTPEMLEESDVVTGYGGQVRILNYVQHQSTTAVVDRILDSARDGGTAGHDRTGTAV